MKEAAQPKGRASGDTDSFEENFKPKRGVVNFGAHKDEGKVKRPKKRMKLPVRLLLIFLIVAVVLGGVTAGLYFTGMLTPAMELVGLVQPTPEPTASLEEREALLDIRDQALTDREAALTKREQELSEKETELDRREAVLEATGDSFQLSLQGLDEDKLTEIKRVGSVYSKMEPAEAAAILNDMTDIMEVSLILYHMQPAASALVLAEMDTARAAEITRNLLS